MHLSQRKRHRRTALEIERAHVCSICNKSYGSEGSLSQHIKLKHQAQSVKMLADLKLKSQQLDLKSKNEAKWARIKEPVEMIYKRQTME